MYDVTSPAWSPDGTKIASATQCNRLSAVEASHVMNADWTRASGHRDDDTANDSRGPDWQPILRATPAPSVGHPARALVPAYETCTQPNRVHAAAALLQLLHPPPRPRPSSRSAPPTPTARPPTRSPRCGSASSPATPHARPTRPTCASRPRSPTSEANRTSPTTPARSRRGSRSRSPTSPTPPIRRTGTGHRRGIRLSYSVRVPCTATADTSDRLRLLPRHDRRHRCCPAPCSRPAARSGRRTRRSRRWPDGRKRSTRCSCAQGIFVPLTLQRR